MLVDGSSILRLPSILHLSNLIPTIFNWSNSHVSRGNLASSIKCYGTVQSCINHHYISELHGDKWPQWNYKQQSKLVCFLINYLEVSMIFLICMNTKILRSHKLSCHKHPTLSLITWTTKPLTNWIWKSRNTNRQTRTDLYYIQNQRFTIAQAFNNHHLTDLPVHRGLSLY